jgi:hypothetical protein
VANFKANNYADLQLGSTAAAHTLPVWAAAGTTMLGLLVDAGVDAPQVTDADWADFASGVVKASTRLTCTISNGVLDVADFSFVSTTGNESEWIAFVEQTGTTATSPLTVAFDTATGLPVTPNGSDIDVLIHPSGLLKETV